MLNYKCKSPRGRSPSNRTGALCIAEVDTIIIRAFVVVIPNKKNYNYATSIYWFYYMDG